MKDTKPTVILQARMGSSRLPGKVIREINGKPMVIWQISRILRARRIGKLIVATTVNEEDDLLCSILESNKIEYFRGSEEDVYARFLEIVETIRDEYFIRLTADCPLVMPELIDDMIEKYLELNLDYISNSNPPTFPDGLDIEIIKSKTFVGLKEQDLSNEEREHVTLALYNGKRKYEILNHNCSINLSNLRWTVDYEEDFQFVKEVYSEFLGVEAEFQFKDLMDLLNSKPLLVNRRSGLYRNIKLRGEDS